jgi:hypothetical protein
VRQWSNLVKVTRVHSCVFVEKQYKRNAGTYIYMQVLIYV